MTQFIHFPELRALGAVLLTHAKVQPLMDALHCAVMQTEVGACISFAIRVLESKDLDVDLLSVYEFVQQRTCMVRFPHGSRQATLELLTAMVQCAAIPATALAYLQSLARAEGADADLSDEEQPWS